MGWCYYKQENHTIAMECYDKSLAIDPNYYKAWRNKAEIFFMQNKYKETAESLRHCLRIKPDDSQASAQLQICEMILEKEGKNVEAQQARRTDKDFSIGQVVLGRFEIRAIHKGGMGIVYCVWDRQFIRMFALKTFQSQFLFHPIMISQFFLEAETWVKLGTHPNIVTAFTVEQIGGRPYVLMEYVEGKVLRSWIASEKLNLLQILDFGIQFCTGMMYVAQRELGDGRKGMLHRDIKPENILITSDNILKITDFGLAKSFFDSLTLSNNEGQSETSHAVEQSGLAGTIPYMSPEQLMPNAKLKEALACYDKALDAKRNIHRDLNFDLNRPIVLDPEEEKTWYNRGVTLRQMGQIQAALQSQQKALELNPRASLAWAEMGFINLKLGNYEKALDCFQKAMESNRGQYLHLLGGEDVDELHSLTNALEDKDRYSEALIFYDALTLVRPDSNEIWNARGLCLAHLNKYTEAIISYDKAIYLNPLAYRPWLNKGLVLGNQGRYTEALTCIEEVMKLNPQHKNAHILKQRLLDAMASKNK